jgi:hypothetical protein
MVTDLLRRLDIMLFYKVKQNQEGSNASYEGKRAFTYYKTYNKHAPMT